ncbi:MAG TPA: hypothetical protein VFT90_09620, partial [Chryseosolibacter sp.]|nr:hypothetical protein [Chryseosolibacter sp.]
GVLLYCGRDDDPFQSVQEWWNSDGNNFKAPSEHLFMKLGLKAPFKAGEYSYGKGTVHIMRNDPKEFVMNAGGDGEFVKVVKKLYEENSRAGKLMFKNHFALTRGPYEIISVLDEHGDQSPYTIKGKFIDLFDPEIPVLDEKQVMPGEQAFLFNIGSVKDRKAPQVLATAARVYEEKTTGNSYSFVAKSPLNTTNVMRVLLPKKPGKIEVTDPEGKHLQAETSWDESSNTSFLSFENYPDGVRVKLSW